MTRLGFDLVWCLLVLSLVPWISVIGYEAADRANRRAVDATTSP